MERNKQNTEDIISLAAGRIEPKLKDEMFSAIEQDPESEKIYNKAKGAFALLASTNRMPEYQIEDSYKKLHARLNSRKTLFLPAGKSLLKYAAALILLLGVSSLFFYLKNQGNLAGYTELKYTTVVAKYKQISEVILPDSSVVWLNSGSTLTYNNNYSLDNRDLVIKGEAYFDIRKNKKIPLTVSFNNFKVKVLGTKFNVCAYPDNTELTVALEKGSVELVNTTNAAFNCKLKPGEIAECDVNTKEIKVKEATVRDYSAWKEGLLVFKDTPMDEVIKILERKFNTEFIVEDPAIYEPSFNATFKDENLAEVLDYIQYTCHISYKLTKDSTNKTIIKLY